MYLSLTFARFGNPSAESISQYSWSLPETNSASAEQFFNRQNALSVDCQNRYYFTSSFACSRNVRMGL
jgi:hypothetical protein